MVTHTQNVTNNVSSDAEPDVDLSGKSSLKSVNISLLNSSGVSQESIPHSVSYCPKNLSSKHLWPML
jgi:hypothetical protein